MVVFESGVYGGRDHGKVLQVVRCRPVSASHESFAVTLKPLLPSLPPTRSMPSRTFVDRVTPDAMVGARRTPSRTTPASVPSLRNRRRR